ncbi:chitinase [uncultured Cetobacterium sp.]|uniref:chitinase n=1 Tax=uncultured Cetobacterium sp. TaxID=527638 RepID=UPI0026312297|nr:chitinase [uncultured Cetobacterium sp.]
MNSNTELDFQVNDLKNKISALFDKFKTLQSNMNIIMDVVRTNPEYNVAKNKLDQLIDFSNNLSNLSNIDQFFQIKTLAFDLEKIIFDLEHIIESNPPEIIFPEIKKAILKDDGSFKGELKDISDPELRLNNIEYRLFKVLDIGTTEIETITYPETLFKVDFNYRDTGIYYFIATYFYEGDNDVVQSQTITSNTIEVLDLEKTIPSICCAGLVLSETNPIGVLTKVNDEDNAIFKNIFTLKNELDQIIETLETKSIPSQIDFKNVTQGKYYFQSTSYYNTGMQEGEISIISNTVEVLKETEIPPETDASVWKDCVFSPFVDAARDDVFLKFPFADVSKQIGIPFYNLGFITADSNFNASWGGSTQLPGSKGTTAGLKQDVERLRSMGGDICISFGGLTGPYLNEVIDNPEVLKNKYLEIINAWNLTRVDFDMEHNSILAGETCQANKINHTAIAMMQSELKNSGKAIDVWFTLPTMPYGLNQNELLLLDDALKKGVEIAGINIMAMCYGSAYSGNMAEQAIDAAKNLHRQLQEVFEKNRIFKTDEEIWKMIGICPEIGINDTGIFNTFYTQDANTLLDFCQLYKVGMISFWSSNRDKENDGSILNGPDSSGIIQENLEFSKIFQKYNTVNFQVKPLNPNNDCGIYNNTPIWHESMSYPSAGNKVFYQGKYYSNSWYVSAWDFPPNLNEAWKEIQ